MLHTSLLSALLLFSVSLTHTAAELTLTSADTNKSGNTNTTYHIDIRTPRFYPALVLSDQTQPASNGNLWTYLNPIAPAEKTHEISYNGIMLQEHQESVIERILSLFLPNKLPMDQLNEKREVAIDTLENNYDVSDDILVCLRKANTAAHTHYTKELLTQTINKELHQATNDLIVIYNIEQASVLYQQAQESLDRLKPATAELRIAQQTYIMALNNLLKLLNKHQQPLSNTLHYLQEQVDLYFQYRTQKRIQHIPQEEASRDNNI